MIQEIINTQLRKERDEREKKEQTTWWASSLGSCLTGAYLARAGLGAKDFDDRTLRVFKVGTMFEDWLVDLIAKSGEKYETQKRIEIEEFNLSGKIDITLDGVIHEIKTINSRAFAFLKDEAKLQHRMQIWTYLYATKSPEGKIVYLEKDGLNVREFTQLLDDNQIERAVRNELNILNTSWKAQLPPEPYPTEDWRSRYCSLHGLCKSQKQYYQFKKI